MDEFIKVPVEYVIETTSDWTQFEIVVGGFWENFDIVLGEGKEKIAKNIERDKNRVRIEKGWRDQNLAVVRVKCTLNVNKDYCHSSLTYKITKGDLQSTSVTIFVRGKEILPPLINDANVPDDEKNTIIFCSPVQNYLQALKNKVFIVHGRDTAPALELKNYLKDTFNLDAVIFDDAKKKRTSATIIEILENIVANACYAFIVATPDDLGCFSKDLEKSERELLYGKKSVKAEEVAKFIAKFNRRARENVVFEQGLFIGALGRDRVCCLLNTNIKDKPTDIDGVLYEQFTVSIGETFSQITEKLKEVGLIKA